MPQDTKRINMQRLKDFLNNNKHNFVNGRLKITLDGSPEDYWFEVCAYSTKEIIGFDNNECAQF